MSDLHKGTYMYKVLLTGANGMLGSDIIPILSKKYDLLATSRDELDITDYSKFQKVVDDFQPDWIFHLAALTDLDFCEKEPEIAMKINAISTGQIAKIASERNIKMLYISTSGVFPGDSTEPYTEYDMPAPVSVYGQSKFEGELLLKKYLKEEHYLILRAGWLFGGGEKDFKFVGKMFKLMKKLDRVKVVTDIKGSPNYSLDIAMIIKILLDKNASGLYHTVNEGIASRYDIAVKIKEFANIDVIIDEATASDFPAVAPRPPMEGIINMKLLEDFDFQMRSWQDSLREYVLRLKNLSQTTD